MITEIYNSPITMQMSTATKTVLETKDSGDESDGTSALKRVKDQEDAAGSRRGPANSSMKHFHEPIPTVEQKSGVKRWEFRCRYCTWCVAISWLFQRSTPCLKFHTILSSVRTFTQTIEGDSITFDDKPILPKLNNLATHYNECKKKVDSMNVDEDKEPLSAQMNLKRSAELMAEYLKAGDLNPAVIPTQAGFLRLFRHGFSMRAYHGRRAKLQHSMLYSSTSKSSSSCPLTRLSETSLQRFLRSYTQRLCMNLR
jgi:hypothetical protein